jgi:hypothetical protein
VGFEPTTPGLKGSQVRKGPFSKSGKRMFPVAARSFRRVRETILAPVAHDSADDCRTQPETGGSLRSSARGQAVPPGVAGLCRRQAAAAGCLKVDEANLLATGLSRKTYSHLPFPSSTIARSILPPCRPVGGLQHEYRWTGA